MGAVYSPPHARPQYQILFLQFRGLLFRGAVLRGLLVTLPLQLRHLQPQVRVGL